MPTTFPRALALAVGDLADRRILAILAQALALAVLIFIAIAALLLYFLAGSNPCTMVGRDCPLDVGSGSFGAIILTLVAAWLLFPGVAIAVVSGFADRIAAVVEERHYPDAAASAKRIGIGQAAWLGLKSGGRLLLYNLVAIPFYLLLLITGIGPFILFVIVNGLAMGRDLGELAATRHLAGEPRRTWLSETKGTQRLMGCLVSLLFLVPFANLVAPVIGVAMAVHLFQRGRARPGVE